ncbi:hypothetical protein [Chitinimonas koreensis]|uniref:hypothetical protein n=1 Tax=Chitinimonas koreensis TaxID=356302 RepID=UPI00146FBF62|nr:hypothetical protein [Chitinimonas koreensis]QNM97420.1 hypothetical protein H9L41_03675 [Chitinimonas koreensis]
MNYTFSATTSPDYIFEGITNVQGLEGQFSAPSVAVDGRMMTFSDWNSVNGTINFSLQIANRSSGARHLHDPEVVNTGH